MAEPGALAENVAEVTFGAGGNAADFIIKGWAPAEDGFTWSLEDESRLVLPDVKFSEAHDYWLELRLNPFRVPGVLDSQLLNVSVNGAAIGKDKVKDAATLAYHVPHHVLAGAADGKARITLHHPAFAQPSALSDNADSRPLAFMLFHIRLLRRPLRKPADLTALPPVPLPASEEELGLAVLQSEGVPAAEIALLFESLGPSCEFGLVQRKLQAEPLGLLRFSAIALQYLLLGLDRRFEGLGESFRVAVEGVRPGFPGVYMLHDDGYSFATHSFVEAGTESPERVRKRVSTHIRRLRQAFFEKLTFGDLIAVISRPEKFLLAEAHALHLALQRLGNTALLVVDKSEALPCGAVERLDHGLYHGKLDWFAPIEDRNQNDIVGWTSLCINARRLWRLEK